MVTVRFHLEKSKRERLLKALNVQKNAKIVRPFVEKLITISKTPGPTTKRKLHDLLKNDAAEKKVIKEFWEGEMKKCEYQAKRKKQRIEDKEEEEKSVLWIIKTQGFHFCNKNGEFQAAKGCNVGLNL